MPAYRQVGAGMTGIMRKQLKRLLESAGLKNEEVKIYLLLLKLQKSTISELTYKSGLNFMMVYRTIDRLLERGLIEKKSLNEKQNFYVPLSLKKLIRRIQSEQRKLHRLAAKLKGLDPLLPFVDVDREVEDELIEVKEGLDSFREEYLKMPDLCNENYYHIGAMHNYWDVAQWSYDCPEERGFIRKRLNNGIFARILNTPCKEADDFCPRDTIEKRESRIVDELPLTNNYMGFAENQISLFICDKDDPRVVVIKEPDLLKMHHNQFKNLWRGSST